MKSYPEIEKAAAKLGERLRDTGKGELTDMVIKLYTLSRIAAENAKEDIDWLQTILKDIAKCLKSSHRTFKMKEVEKDTHHGCVIGDIAEALDEFSDESADANGYNDNQDDQDHLQTSQERIEFLNFLLNGSPYSKGQSKPAKSECRGMEIPETDTETGDTDTELVDTQMENNGTQTDAETGVTADAKTNDTGTTTATTATTAKHKIILQDNKEEYNAEANTDVNVDDNREDDGEDDNKDDEDDNKDDGEDDDKDDEDDDKDDEADVEDDVEVNDEEL